MRGNRCGDDVLPVRSAGTTVTTALTAVVLPVTASRVSGGFTVGLVMAVPAYVTVEVSKSVMLERSETVATFPVRAFFVGRCLIFCVEVRFWRESWVPMGTLDESLSDSDSSSDNRRRC